MHKVFVYGSLLSGMGNHDILANSKLLGATNSPRRFLMVDLGYFPGVIEDDFMGDSVIGEVYEVDDVTLNRLNRLEGYNEILPSGGMYDRKEIDTEFGKALIYIYNYGHSTRRFIEKGDWRNHYNKKFKE